MYQKGKNPNTSKGTHANIVNKLPTILNRPGPKIDLIYESGLLVEPHSQINFFLKKINIYKNKFKNHKKNT